MLLNVIKQPFQWVHVRYSNKELPVRSNYITSNSSFSRQRIRLLLNVHNVQWSVCGLVLGDFIVKRLRNWVRFQFLRDEINLLLLRGMKHSPSCFKCLCVWVIHKDFDKITELQVYSICIDWRSYVPCPTHLILDKVYIFVLLNAEPGDWKKWLWVVERICL